MFLHQDNFVCSLSRSLYPLLCKNCSVRPRNQLEFIFPLVVKKQNPTHMRITISSGERSLIIELALLYNKLESWVLGRLQGVLSLKIFKDLRNPGAWILLPSPVPIAQIVLFHSMIIQFYFLLPSLGNVIKEHDYSLMSSSPKKLFPPPCPQPTVQHMLCCFDVDLI